MHLEHLSVENFRCVGRFEHELRPGRVLIVGENASGKTSLLEATFYLVTGRSFRTRYDNDCLRWHTPPGALAAVRGRVRRACGDSCRLAVTLGAGHKAVRVDGKPLAQLAELWGRLHAVLFTPDDLQLIKGGPGARRRYLDVALSQLGRDFLFHLQRYGQALRQRNALLKQHESAGRALREEVAPWDEQLIEHGLPILRKRFDFLLALEPRAARLYEKIRGGEPETAETGQADGEAQTSAPREALRLSYANFLHLDAPSDEDTARKEYRERLREGLGDDLRRRMTNTGPHRDDFTVYLSGKPVRDFGSQGQIRSCVLALRLAEVVEMEARTGDPPLVLLDDLASELDPARKRQVLELLDPGWQTFLTTTQRDDFPPDSEFSATIQLPRDLAEPTETGAAPHDA